MKLRIDNHELEIDEPLTIYQVAKRAGIDIPVMCYKEGYGYFTSCMICMVKDKQTGATLPACSAMAAEGMDIDTQCEEIRDHRKATLELLLSEHVGDCEAPCHRLCAVHSEIPKMIREIRANQMQEAIATIRRDMAIPSILERFCHAPCEKGCRRVQFDEAVSIRELTRYAADWDLMRDNPFAPAKKPTSGRKVAIVGAGVSGLSTAFYLALEGHECTIFEKENRPGGRLNTEFDRAQLPDWVLDGELNILRKLGIQFELSRAVGDDVSMDRLKETFDAIVLTCGRKDATELEKLGVSGTDKGIAVNPKTVMTSVEGMFATGSVVKEGQPILKLVQNAKWTAACISQYVNHQPIVGILEMYNHVMGRLLEGEIDVFVSGANPRPRVHSEDQQQQALSKSEAELETSRCLHCDCREAHNCKLRIYSHEYGARQTEFKGEERARYIHINQDSGALYEPGKCINCGLCVRITRQESEPFGFTFIGRGFNVKPGVSLNKSLKEGLEKVARLVIESCPTGALALNEKYIPKECVTVGEDIDIVRLATKGR